MCGSLGGCKDKLFAASLSKMESQHPPVQQLVTPKAISLFGSRTLYVKPSLTPAANSSQTHRKVDVKHQVSNCSGPYLPAFSKLGMSLSSSSAKVLFSWQRVPIVWLRSALRQWEPLWQRCFELLWI